MPAAQTRSGARSPAPLALAGALVRWTGRGEGDLRPGLASTPARLAELTGQPARPVSWLRQVHGDRVVVVDGAEPVQGEEGDSLVTTSAGSALAVFTADCAPVALASPEGVLAAVHAGWAGLVAGVVERTVDTMRRLGATRVDAALGPCIHAECYEFAGPDLDRVSTALGGAVRGVTRGGSPAMDLPAAVRVALERAGASLEYDADGCTACKATLHWSHRARGEAERQAMLVWHAR